MDRIRSTVIGGSRNAFASRSFVLCCILNIEKVRAPGRNKFRKGLGWGDDDRLCTSWRLPTKGVIPAHDDQEQTDAGQRDIEAALVFYRPLRQKPPECVADNNTDPHYEYEEIHLQPPQDTVFSMAKLPQRLSVSYDSDSILRMAYYGPYVKPKQKSSSLAFLVSQFV